MKLCADSVGWNYENGENSSLLNVEQIVYFFLLFSWCFYTFNFFVFCKCFVCSLHTECQVMVISFGCYHADGRGTLQSPNCSKSCKVWRKIGEGEMEDDRDMVMEFEGVQNLGRMGILSCSREGIRMLVCVLVLVVAVMLAVVLV